MRHQARIRWIAIAAALCAAGAATASDAFDATPPDRPPDFTEVETKRLDSGGVVKRSETFDNEDGTRSGRGVAYVRIDAPPEAILDAILGYDRYAEFYPNVEESTLYERTDDTVYKARFVLTALGGLLRVRYHCRHAVDRERYTVTWRLDETQENDFRRTVGFWKIWPLDGGRCLVAYSVVVDSGMKIPRVVEELGTGYGLSKVAACMKRRVESIRGANPPD